jgi:FixJ family two-component response regulator
MSYSGKSTKEIVELGTAERTIKAHRAHVMEKMVHSLLSLRGLAQSSGCVDSTSLRAAEPEVR